MPGVLRIIEVSASRCETVEGLSEVVIGVLISPTLALENLYGLIILSKQYQSVKWNNRLTYDVPRLVFAGKQTKRDNDLINIFGGDHTRYHQLAFGFLT